jgi:hypothetical protein
MYRHTIPDPRRWDEGDSAEISLRETPRAIGGVGSALEPYLGNRARVSEVLNRKRPLTLAMIRRLYMGLGIPADVLIQPYSTKAAA